MILKDQLLCISQRGNRKEGREKITYTFYEEEKKSKEEKATAGLQKTSGPWPGRADLKNSVYLLCNSRTMR